MGIVIIIQNEVLSSFFNDFPSGLQFLAPFLVAGCREVDSRIRSKIVNKMLKQHDERASAIITIYISTLYAFFIAIRLVGAEWSTILCTVGIDFFLHSKLTYKIIERQRKVGDEKSQGEIIEKGFITKLLLTEMIEGLAPIIYGICIVMAYYGPNAHMLSNIGNTFWSERIEDIAPIFITMIILFSVDTCSVIINFYCLWRSPNV